MDNANGAQSTETPADETLDDGYPTLSAVLREYFTTGKSDLFVATYRAAPDSARFDGLVEEMELAIRRYRHITPQMNTLLGTNLTEMETRDALADLLDMMRETGEYSPDAIAQAEAADKQGKPDPDTVMDYWLTRRITIPLGALRKYAIPMWVFLVGGGALVLLGIGLGQLTLPEWLSWAPTAILALGAVIVILSALVMNGLRNEILHPERRDRDAKKGSARGEKGDKPERKGLTARVRGMFR